MGHYHYHTTMDKILSSMGAMDLKGMTADQLMSALQKHQETEKKTMGEPLKTQPETATLAPHIESSPRGAYPGRTRATPGERGGVDRERARTKLFPTDSMGKWIMENSTCSTMLV